MPRKKEKKSFGPDEAIEPNWIDKPHPVQNQHRSVRYVYRPPLTSWTPQIPNSICTSINSQTLADVPAITVPARFQLHTLVDSASQPRPYLMVKNDRKLFINRAGKLASAPALDPTLQFQSAPVHSGPIPVLLNYRNAQERQTVKAALGALTDVYAVRFGD